MNITKEQADKVIAALEAMASGLEWFRDMYPKEVNEDDHVMIAEKDEALSIMRGLEDAAPFCNHEWFQTGAMLSNEKRCIKCGEWGKLYTSPQAAQTEAALCEMVRLSEDAGLYDSDFQAGRAGSKP